jgi:YHS domain-containing protein
MTKRSKILALFLVFLFSLAISGIAQQQAEEKVVCPVCGHQFNKSGARATYEYEGKNYYFCSNVCKENFMKNPEKYLEKKEEMKAVYTCPMHPEVESDKPGKCPKCGMNLEKKMMPMEHVEASMHKEMMHQGQMDKMMMHKKGEEETRCPMIGATSCKDVEMIVDNIEDGITVKITSKNADVVKKIQEMAARMKEMHKKAEAEKEEVEKK